ncbi:MAG: DUF5107 domain-containing protein [Acidobacteria bacterium]|nr:DUF5107 domain-containing protein [Acidobacteriota bacterium]
MNTKARRVEWKVVTLENDLVEVFVLPEIGGKVWGARVKKTGHEFIYRNEVVKFRNIALRGPWTSGGIEFNFGVIGPHARHGHSRWITCSSRTPMEASAASSARWTCPRARSGGGDPAAGRQGIV